MIYSVNHFVVYVCNAHLDTKGVCVCMPKNWQRTSHAIILWLFEYATYSILMQYWLLFSNCFFFVCLFYHPPGYNPKYDFSRGLWRLVSTPAAWLKGLKCQFISPLGCQCNILFQSEMFRQKYGLTLNFLSWCSWYCSIFPKKLPKTLTKCQSVVVCRLA